VGGEELPNGDTLPVQPALEINQTFDETGRSDRPGTSGQVGNGSAQFPYRPAMELTQTYDGAGQPAKRAQTQRQNGT
jgi:hypothetical protein